MRRPIRTIVAALAVVLAASAALDAELKYTLRAEVKPSSSPAPAAPANPMFTMIGDTMMQQMAPSGPADIVYIVGDKGVRTEFKGTALGNPAGTVILVRPNGDMVNIDTNAKTYWKATAADVAKLLAAVPVVPVVTTKKTDDVATIVGVRTQRMSFELSIQLPIPPELLTQLPPGFPTSLSITGDTWLAGDQYKNYAAMVAKTGGAAFGLNKIMAEGLLLRQVMRSPLFGGREFELVATQLAEEKVDPTLFDIPAGYKEVPSPIAGIGGLEGR